MMEFSEIVSNIVICVLFIAIGYLLCKLFPLLGTTKIPLPHDDEINPDFIDVGDIITIPGKRGLFEVMGKDKGVIEVRKLV